MPSAARTYGLSNLVSHVGVDGILKDVILVSGILTFTSTQHSFSSPKLKVQLCVKGEGGGLI